MSLMKIEILNNGAQTGIKKTYSFFEVKRDF